MVLSLPMLGGSGWRLAAGSTDPATWAASLPFSPPFSPLRSPQFSPLKLPPLPTGQLANLPASCVSFWPTGQPFSSPGFVEIILPTFCAELNIGDELPALESRIRQCHRGEPDDKSGSPLLLC